MVHIAVRRSKDRGPRRQASFSNQPRRGRDIFMWASSRPSFPDPAFVAAEAKPRANHAPTVPDMAIFASGGALPLVNRQCQSAAHAHVVDTDFIMIGGDHVDASSSHRSHGDRVTPSLLHKLVRREGGVRGTNSRPGQPRIASMRPTASAPKMAVKPSR